MSYKSLDKCLEKALPDEMLFVLMARDPTAPKIVRAWAGANVGKQPREKIQEALDCADEMEKTCADVNARKNTQMTPTEVKNKLPNEYWFYNENGNVVDVLSTVGEWCMVSEEFKDEPYVLPLEFVLAIYSEHKPHLMCKHKGCRKLVVCEGYCAAHCNCKA